MIIGMWLFACAESKLEDGWWQNEEANPYASSGGGEGGEGGDVGGGDESAFYGILQAVGDELYEGESGVEADGCMWYAGISGVAAEACGDCDFAVSVTFGGFEIFDDGDCPDEFGVEAFEEHTLVLGFGGETTWRLNEGDWVEYAFCFQESDYFGWYIEL